MEESLSISIAIVVGLVEIAKRIGLPTKFCPLLSVVLGLGVSLISDFSDWKKGLFSGLIVGLSASGLYDIAKKPVVAITSKLPKLKKM